MPQRAFEIGLRFVAALVAQVFVEKIAAFPAGVAHAERKQAAAEDATRMRIETDMRAVIKKQIQQFPA